jgi:hypothetical protein
VPHHLDPPSAMDSPSHATTSPDLPSTSSPAGCLLTRSDVHGTLMMEGSSCDSGGERGEVATAEEQASRGGRGDERGPWVTG